MNKHQTASYDSSENMEKCPRSPVSSVRIFESAFNRVVPTEITKRIFKGVPLELTWAQKETPQKENQVPLTLNELVDQSFEKILENISCAYNNYISDPWQLDFIRLGSQTHKRKDEIQEAQNLVPESVEDSESIPKKPGILDPFSKILLDLQFKNKINWEQNTGTNEDLNTSINRLERAEEGKNINNVEVSHLSEETIYQSPSLPGMSQANWNPPAWVNGVNIEKELIEDAQNEKVLSPIQQQKVMPELMDELQRNLEIIGSLSSDGSNNTEWGHISKIEQKSKTSINNITSKDEFITGEKDAAPIQILRKSKRKKRMRKRLQIDHQGLTSYTDGEIVSDTIPINSLQGKKLSFTKTIKKDEILKTKYRVINLEQRVKFNVKKNEI